MKAKDFIKSYIELQKDKENASLSAKDVSSKEYLLETVHIHFRGIPFLLDLLDIHPTQYHYHVEYLCNNCRFIEAKEGEVNSDELTSYLNFAIADIQNCGGLEFYLLPDPDIELALSISYQSDFALVYKAGTDIAIKIADLEQRYPLLFYENI
jgi:hypothetical protein